MWFPSSIFKPMQKRFLVIFLLFFLPSLGSAQIYFDTQSDSRLWLEGSSTVHRFDCVARSIQGTAYIEGMHETDRQKLEMQGQHWLDGQTESGPDMEAGYRDVRYRPHYHREAGDSSGDRSDAGNINPANLHVLLKIPIKSFDCRHSRMNRDMYEALKSDKYDYITFEFENARSLERSPSVSESLFDDGYQPFQIDGVLNVAGVDRNVTLLVRGRPEGEGRYRILGQKEISMQDFEIDPPTALRGLIRAHDDLTVFFDLHVLEKNQD